MYTHWFEMQESNYSWKMFVLCCVHYLTLLPYTAGRPVLSEAIAADISELENPRLSRNWDPSLTFCKVFFLVLQTYQDWKHCLTKSYEAISLSHSSSLPRPKRSSRKPVETTDIFADTSTSTCNRLIHIWQQHVQLPSRMCTTAKAGGSHLPAIGHWSRMLTSAEEKLATTHKNA